MVKHRKLKMELRETAKERSISFTKRRQGLFNKAANLSVISDAHIALWVTSPCAKGKTYSFTSHHSIDAIVNNFLQGRVPEPTDDATKISAMSLWHEISMQESNNLRQQKVASEDNVGAAQWCLDEFENCDSVQVLKDIVDRLESLRNGLITKRNGKSIYQIVPLNSYAGALPLNCYPANHDILFSSGFNQDIEDNVGGVFNSNPNVAFDQNQNQGFFHDQCYQNTEWKNKGADEKQEFEEFDSVLECFKNDLVDDKLNEKEDGGGVLSSNMNDSMWNWGIENNDASLWTDFTSSANLPEVPFQVEDVPISNDWFWLPSLE